MSAVAREAAARWASAAVEEGARGVSRWASLAGLLASPPKPAVGETPSEVVWRENKLALRRYLPAPGTVRKEADPVVVVYALVNRPYILDLQPDRSVVRRLLEAGLDVYLIDWGEPSHFDRALALDDYVDRYIARAVDVARERADAERANLLGYCMGGALSAMYAAREPESVRTLALMAAPLTFAGETGLLHAWSRAGRFDVDAVVGGLGNVPGSFLNGGYQLMKPIENTVGKMAGLFRNVDDPEFVENWLRMERWVSDDIPVAGEAYREFVKALYQEDALARGRLEIGGERVDPGRITMPFLQIVGEYDHLVPPSESLPFSDVVGAKDKEAFVAATGHIGLSVSSRAHRDLWPRVTAWMLARQGRSRGGRKKRSAGPSRRGEPQARQRVGSSAKPASPRTKLPAS